MKKILSPVANLLSTATLLFLLASCTPKSKTVDYPLIAQANTETLDIARVELTDSATVLHMDAYFHPHYWIRIGSDSYLKAGDKNYSLTGAEGIEPDSLFWMPDSGKAHFVLRFEPMPADTRTFDFIEGNVEGAFKLFDIDLTGKKTFGQPEDLPKEALSPDLPDSVPVPMLKSGETTVRIHLMGYLPESGIEKPTLYANTIFGQQEPHEVAIDPKTGQGTVTFWQNGPVLSFLILDYNKGGYCGSAWLAPGETADLYIDMHAGRYRFNQKYRSGKAGQPKQRPLRSMYTTGVYAGLNHVLSNPESKPHYGMERHNGNFADWRMTSAQYAAHVADRYKSLADSIAQSGLTALEKEYATLSLRQEACHAMANSEQLRAHNYRSEHNLWDYNVQVDSISPIHPEDAQQIATLFDITDPKLLMGDNITDLAVAIVAPETDWMQADRLPRGPLKDLRQTVPLIHKADNAQMKQSDLEELKAAGTDPFFLNLLQRKQQDAEEKLTKMSNMVLAAPDVPLERLFKAIIAPHKGKVVLVDFWNTWCGPCRAAIKANEPLKQGELKNDNLVWIYIANETSPVADYMKTIPGIQGLHYRLNNEQWRQLVDKDFDIDGIPSYVMVDKAGRYSLRNDLRDHNQLKETLKKALAE